MFKTQQIFLINGRFFTELNGGASYVKVPTDLTPNDGDKCKLVLMNSQQGQYFQLMEIVK